MTRLRTSAGMTAVLLTMALASTAYYSVMRLVAELTAQDPRFQFERWSTGKAKPSEDEVSAAVAQMRVASAYEPGNPNLHSDVGRLEYWQARTGALDDQLARSRRERALLSFRQAANLRPTSGHTWANVALTRYTLGQVDVEFAHALQQTLHWAPWQPQLQLLGIELGLAVWQALDEPSQRMVAEAIQQQKGWRLVDQKPALIQLLRRYGRKELGCPWAGVALGCSGA